MRHRVSRVASAAFVSSLCWWFSALASSPALAQFGGQPGGGMGPGMGPAPDETKAEGPAEEAPEEEEQPTDAAPLGGYPGQARRATRVFELGGYFRFRGDFFHKLHLDQTYLGMPNSGNRRTPPHPIPLECGTGSEERCESRDLGNGNLRLRLAPTLNVTDQVRVLAEVDVLDNVIMGSTPDSLYEQRRPEDRRGLAPIGALSNTQESPERGRNGLFSSIRAKRAWGEVDSEFGSLSFGRMPWHFGRGIAFNNGNCQDCDFGTTVDRVMARTQLYGHQLALSWDFGDQGYNIGRIDLGARDPEGPPLDLSQEDDVTQYMFSIAKLDDEQRFADRAAMGEVMFNYGAQLVYRAQGRGIYDIDAGRAAAGMPVDTSLPPTSEQLSTSVTHNIDARMVLPGLWMKLGWKALTLEAEASGVIGRIGNAGPLATDTAVDGKRLTLRQFGWVLATDLRLAKNALFIGFETGGATGDQAEDPRTYLNTRWKFVPQPPGDRSIRDFKFSPDYHIDEILFRRIIGTVTNALYVKPKLTYWLDLAERRKVGLSAAGIYSMALEPVSTPGNGLPYGIEMNLGLNYRNDADGFYAGFTWAVLWPLSALDRPSGESNTAQSLWLTGQDAGSAQAVRFFLGIKF